MENNPTYSILAFPGSKVPETYMPLIFSRWLRSLRYGNTLFNRITPKDYYRSYHKFIENLLAKPDSLVRLAVLSDDHDVVLGFSVSREDVLDYVHVQADYRKNGIGKNLVPEKITTFTHLTKTALQIWQPKYKEKNFNPFA